MELGNRKINRARSGNERPHSESTAAQEEDREEGLETEQDDNEGGESGTVQKGGHALSRQAELAWTQWSGMGVAIEAKKFATIKKASNMIAARRSFKRTGQHRVPPHLTALTVSM